MAPRILHYSDLENACDDPERLGRVVGTLAAHRDEETVVAGSGDTIAPSVLSLETDGRHALHVFDVIRPDVETLGNHDFDRGIDRLRGIVRESPPTWVSANVSEPRTPSDDGFRPAGASDDEPLPGTVPTTVLERGGMRIGFVGVSDPASSIPPFVPVADPVETVRRSIASLRDVDRLVVLAHLRDSRAREVAAIEAVDVVLAGHVHEETCERVDGDTLLVRPGSNGRVVWDVDCETLEATRLEVACGPIDDATVARFEAAMAETGLSDVVARADRPIRRERERCFDGRCRLGTLVAEAYRWAAGADVGYVDTRGLREGPPLSGAVTVADLVGVVPFDAELVVLEVRGTVLRDLLADTIVSGEAYDGRDRDLRWGQVAGVRVRRNERDRTLEPITVDGEPFEADATYELATNGYVVASDEFPAVDHSLVTNSWGIQYDALVAYVREVGFEVERIADQNDRR